MIQASTYKTAVETYVDSILGGDIASCLATRQAVERYVSDREREGIDPDFPYRFNEHLGGLICSLFPAAFRHFKGKQWNGQPIHLYPAQMFWTWNIFGWYREDGTRRFRKSFVSIGRKGGKSTWCAGLAILMAEFDGEPSAEVYCTASKIDQAKIVFGDAKQMAKQSPSISSRATVQKDNIHFAATNSIIRPLGSDRPFDGLGPSCVIVDELHAWREHHRPFYDTMTTGSGNRDQPLQVIITTAAQDSKAQIFDEEIQYARDVLSGKLVDDQLFAVIYELERNDNIYDESNWVKANPGIGAAPRLDYLQDTAMEASQKPSTERRFKNKNLNICISGKRDAIDGPDYDSASGELSDWAFADAISMGVDLGGQSDLAAYAFCARFPFMSNIKTRTVMYRYEVTTKAFLSSKHKRDLENDTRIRDWIADGEIELCDYVYNSVKAGIIEDSMARGVEFIAIDPRNASQMLEDLEQEGLTAVKMPQSCVHYAEVMIEYESAINEGRLLFDCNDHVLRWCFLNMTVKTNQNGDQMPDKPSSKDKIDAAVAALMSIRAVWNAPARVQGPFYLS